MLITSLQDQRRDFGGDQSVVVFHPTSENYIGLLTSNQFLTFFRNSAFVSIFVVTITNADQRARGFCPGADAVSGVCDTRDRRVPAYLIPDTLLFLPLFKMFADIRLLDRHPVDQQMYVLHDRVRRRWWPVPDQEGHRRPRK